VVPVAFRPPAFCFSVIRFPPGDWAFLAVGLPDTRPDLDGVTTFHTHEPRPGRVPPIPRGRRCSPGRPFVSDRRLPLPSGQSPHPATASHRARPQITRHQRRFKRFTRPAFPSPVAPGWNGRPSASPPSFEPHRQSRRRTSGWGRAMSTGPGQRSRHQPNLQSAHPLVTCDLVSHRRPLIMLCDSSP
jgi:hypothetical protein